MTYDRIWMETVADHKTGEVTTTIGLTPDIGPCCYRCPDGEDEHDVVWTPSGDMEYVCHELAIVERGEAIYGARMNHGLPGWGTA